jgi:hypothetical protein
MARTWTADQLHPFIEFQHYSDAELATYTGHSVKLVKAMRLTFELPQLKKGMLTPSQKEFVKKFYWLGKAVLVEMLEVKPAELVKFANENSLGLRQDSKKLASMLKKSIAHKK